MQSSDNLSATLLESIQNSLVVAAEIGANRLLGLDQDALAGCQEMQGYCIAIDVTDLDFQLYCHPGSWGVRLSRTAVPGKPPDATISGRLIGLVNLATLDDKVSTSMQERVSFQGNVALAQKMQKILSDLDIDWEEALARRTGDVMAFQVNQRSRKLAAWLRQSTDSLLQTSSEYLREEARLSPTVTEFEDFQSRLTELKHDVARTDARLQQLLAKIEPQ